MKTIVHVNQHNVRHNAKTGDTLPVLTVKTYKSNTYAHEVETKYYELLYAVAMKWEGESRHQTALRYIQNAEFTTGNAIAKATGEQQQ